MNRLGRVLLLLLLLLQATSCRSALTSLRPPVSYVASCWHNVRQQSLVRYVSFILSASFIGRSCSRKYRVSYDRIVTVVYICCSKAPLPAYERREDSVRFCCRSARDFRNDIHEAVPLWIIIMTSILDTSFRQPT